MKPTRQECTLGWPFLMAMHLDPDVLLLDEVLQWATQLSAEEMQAMHDLLGRAGTIVFVSHSMASVAELCDWALWLEEGAIAAEGNARDVVEKYRESVARSRTEFP